MEEEEENRLRYVDSQVKTPRAGCTWVFVPTGHDRTTHLRNNKNS